MTKNSIDHISDFISTDDFDTKLCRNIGYFKKSFSLAKLTGTNNTIIKTIFTAPF